MSRPQHLNVPNTSAGISAINEAQRHYDADPEKYEAEERASYEERQREEQNQREEYERQQEENEE